MKYQESEKWRSARRTRKAFCVFCREPMSFFSAWADLGFYFCLSGCDESHPEICRCGAPCVLDDLGEWDCSTGCFGCSTCGGFFRKDDECMDCIAARARTEGPQFCECSSPMVPHGLPPVYVCKAGCSICENCHEPVPFGEECGLCGAARSAGLSISILRPDIEALYDEHKDDDDLPF
jgi:hypothetical protein